MDVIVNREEYVATIRLITWEGERRIDHVFTATVPPGTLVERLEFGVLTNGAERESVLLSLPFGLNGSYYIAPCNSLDHFSEEDNG